MNFHHHEPLVLPRMVTRQLPTGRVYCVEDGADAGASFPSITHILGSRPKPWLHAWQKRVGKDEAQRITQQSAQRGTALHTLTEHYLANDAHAYTDAYAHAGMPVQELWSKLSPWLEEHITGIRAQECGIYSSRLRVAGRTDLIADVDGELAVVDFKNSRRPKTESQVLDYYLQGTFYACALYERTGLATKRLIFPVVSPEQLQIFETTPTANFDLLRERIDEYYANHETPA